VSLSWDLGRGGDQAPGDEEAQHVKMMMITDQEIYSTASLFLRKK
jgi:hypothetical protein